MKKIEKPIIILCIAGLAASLGAIGAYLIHAKNEDKAYRHIEEQVPDNKDEVLREWILEMKKAYPNFIGMVSYGEGAMYPIMQEQIGSIGFYLNHGIDGNPSQSGALYIPANMDGEKPSDNIVIHGHNMRAGTMLGALDEYESESFFRDNPHIELLTKRGEEKYEIAVIYKTAVGTGSKSEFRYCDTADFESADEFAEYIRSAMHRQLYDTGVVPKYGDKLLSLSTCEYSRKNGRLVVLAKRVV